MLTLQYLQSFLLSPPSLLILRVSLVYPRRELLEPLQVGLHRFGRSIERLPVLWLLPVWVIHQVI